MLFGIMLMKSREVSLLPVSASTRWNTAFQAGGDHRLQALVMLAITAHVPVPPETGELLACL